MYEFGISLIVAGSIMVILGLIGLTQKRLAGE